MRCGKVPTTESGSSSDERGTPTALLVHPRDEKVLKFGAGVEPLVICRLAAKRLRDILDGEGEETP